MPETFVRKESFLWASDKRSKGHGLYIIYGVCIHFAILAMCILSMAQDIKGLYSVIIGRFVLVVVYVQPISVLFHQP